MLLISWLTGLLIDDTYRDSVAPLHRLIPGSKAVGGIVVGLFKLIDSLAVEVVGIDLVVDHARLQGVNQRVSLVLDGLHDYFRHVLGIAGESSGYEGAAIYFERVADNVERALRILEEGMTRAESKRWKMLLKARWDRLQQKVMVW